MSPGGWPRWSPPEGATLDRRLRARHDTPGAEPELRSIAAPVVALHPADPLSPDSVPPDPAGTPPAPGAPDTELLHGETVEILEHGDRICRVRALTDGYVGAVAAAALGPHTVPTHRVTGRGVQLYDQPRLKRAPVARLPAPALVAVAKTVEAAGSSCPWGRTACGRFVPMGQLVPLDRPEPDFVAVAGGWLGVPYLWGGRSADGLDCSALVQLALACAGHPAPRDSDMQAAWLGTALPPDAPLRRGDLVFWTGHVGIMEDAATLLHANAHHMTTVREPLAAAEARILAAGGGAITVRKRVDAGVHSP